MSIGRPAAHECAAYYHPYINQVPGEKPITQLQQQQSDTLAFLQAIPADRWDYRYAAGKWTIKEVILHLIDAERVFAYRCLRVGRDDQTPLPGFDQDQYVPSSQANERRPDSLIQEYQAVREATVELLKNLPQEAWTKMGTASDQPVSVRALAYITAGHELHHIKILKERYLSPDSGLA
jgi:uncharacterized damage-inducible protein DinB